MTQVGFTMGSGCIDAVLTEVSRRGSADVETGGYLLAVEEGLVSVVAVAGEDGIERHPLRFGISGGAIGVLFDWIDRQGYSLRAQFHSHKRDAFLSRTDLDHGFSVPGFVTTVVPTYAEPPPDVASWGWWRYEASSWEQAEAPVVASGSATVVVFDEAGVRER